MRDMDEQRDVTADLAHAVATLAREFEKWLQGMRPVFDYITKLAHGDVGLHGRAAMSRSRHATACAGSRTRMPRASATARRSRPGTTRRSGLARLTSRSAPRAP